MASIANNAVGWAQFQLNGGWKNTLTVVLGYAVVIGGIIAVTASIDPRQATTVLSGWTKGLLGLQLAALVVYGSHRIIGGVRRDVTGQMIESHRLMPVPPQHAIAGYVFGAASQAIALAAVNFMLGLFTTQYARLPAGYWLLANAVIASFALFVWTIVVAAALSARGALFWVIGPLLGFWISGGTLALLLPALSVLATPTQGASVFDARVAGRPLELYATSLLWQAAIGGVCVAAAVRKYRRSDAAALSPVLALALLACVVGSSAVGIRWADEFGPRYLYEDGSARTQVVASTMVVMLFAAIAACAAAWGEAVARRRAARRQPAHATPCRAFPPVLAVAIAAALAAPLAWAAPPHSLDRPTVFRFIAGIVLAQAFGVCYLARWMYARVDRAAMVIIVWLAVTWLAPLVVDIVLRAASQHGSEDFGTLATLSPIGCLMAIIDPGRADPRIGLAGQFALVLLPAALFWLDRRRADPPAFPVIVK